MSRLLVRQMIVLLLAVFVTAGIGLSAVQASTMSLKMMDTAPGMGTSGNGKCNDCSSSSDSKAMVACVAPGCVAPVAAHSPSAEALDIASVAVHHLHFNPALLGRDSGPDPYPPRTNDIG